MNGLTEQVSWQDGDPTMLTHELAVAIQRDRERAILATLAHAGVEPRMERGVLDRLRDRVRGRGRGRRRGGQPAAAIAP